MAQRQIPGGYFINETNSLQRQIPGGFFVNETKFKIYYVIGSSTGWVTPQATDITGGNLAGGTASVASGSEAIPPDTELDYTFDAFIDGLAAGDYYIAFVWSDGVEYSDVTVSELFTITVSEVTATAGTDIQELLASVSTVTQVHVTIAASVDQTNYSSVDIVVIPGSAPTLSGITLIDIGTTYGTPRVTITFA